MPVDARLALDFPGYAALVRAPPLSVAEVRSHLAADEALLLFLDTDDRFAPRPEETFMWVVTRTDARWVRSELGTVALAREVAALRCGLDDAAWDGAGKELGLAPCARQGDALSAALRPHSRSQAEVQDLIAGKQLLVVPSGALTQLPFHVLVTDVAEQAPRAPSPSHRTVAWLARRHAVTILPTVASLRELRRIGTASTATRPMIGFGNPLLDGQPSKTNDDARRAREARARRDCPQNSQQATTAPPGARAGVARVATRGGLASLAHLKLQAPLPETADELCAVARAVQADARDIRLGARATESKVKRLNRSGELAQYRIVHFATHGVLAGQLLRAAEEPHRLAGSVEHKAGGKPRKGRGPDVDFLGEHGLILTPPRSASEEDDGYLSASEIAGLKLDAEWSSSRPATRRPAPQPAPRRSRAWLIRSFTRRRALCWSHIGLFTRTPQRSS